MSATLTLYEPLKTLNTNVFCKIGTYKPSGVSLLVASHLSYINTLVAALFNAELLESPGVSFIASERGGNTPSVGYWYNQPVLSHTNFTRRYQFTIVLRTKDAFTESEETLVDPDDLVSPASDSVARNQSHGQQCHPLQLPLILYRYHRLSTGRSNINAVRTSAFYVINTVHDYV
ncbi:hypothetical protein EDD85DRAFT_961293 [Armillaria nabsnona]|nr:hypothetical protein EDD85DRAFT_961293 [Armillaria nabsnona]